MACQHICAMFQCLVQKICLIPNMSIVLSVVLCKGRLQKCETKCEHNVRRWIQQTITMEAIRNTSSNVGGVQCEQVGAIFPHLLKPQLGLFLLILPLLLILLQVLLLLLLLLQFVLLTLTLLHGAAVPYLSDTSSIHTLSQHSGQIYFNRAKIELGWLGRYSCLPILPPFPLLSHDDLRISLIKDETLPSRQSMKCFCTSSFHIHVHMGGVQKERCKFFSVYI